MALIDHFSKKCPWVWRCHIELSNPHGPTWEYLTRFIEKYDAVILSRKEYQQKLPTPQLFFMPAIDPFSIKNKELTEAEMTDRLGQYKIPTDLPLVVQVSRSLGQITERTKAGLASARARGRKGGAPLRLRS